ncbi:hypothetical protein VBM87_00795 [Mycoplasma sp. 744]|uniref:hypothetical protein n=1 Tax=unclassified Mycoplasma TaxID=2683645 RepID=UPI00211C7036|nr:MULTISPECIES: hypothetical protein [unclassified Mycoplasma]MEA4115323.1 hypothetical protein [Mycoplasma sp. 744]UUM19327.1 hypothetical protein NPA14_00405 [Mycoplasma sp. 1018B]
MLEIFEKFNLAINSKDNNLLKNIFDTLKLDQLIRLIHYVYGKDLQNNIKFTLSKYHSNLIDSFDIYNSFLFDLKKILKNYDPNLNKTNFWTYLNNTSRLYAINKVKYWNAKKRNIKCVDYDIEDFSFIEDIDALKDIFSSIEKEDFLKLKKLLNEDDLFYLNYLKNKNKHISAQKINLWRKKMLKKLNAYYGDKYKFNI